MLFSFWISFVFAIGLMSSDLMSSFVEISSLFRFFIHKFKGKRINFQNPSKERETKTADWRLGLCENIFHTSKNIFLASREEEWKKSRLKENV